MKKFFLYKLQNCKEEEMYIYLSTNVHIILVKHHAHKYYVNGMFEHCVKHTDQSKRFFIHYVYEYIFSYAILPNCFRAFTFAHCPLKVKVQPALLFSSFVHNFWINEVKNIKLSENIYYVMANWILY